MAIARYTPYVSEFEYASRYHPSKNPDCPTSGWADNAGIDLGARRYRRSPEEGAPVGQEPSIEVRAILVRCPKIADESDDVMINRNVYNITAGRSQDILDFHGFDRDEPAHRSEVRDCRRKIIITMKFNNIGRTKTREEFVVIDHVLDPVTMRKARLLNPFVVKVRQEPVLQLYGLKFQGVINAEAREEVINKKLSNYTGCDDTSDNPTCGQMLFEGKPIPYSQGFCCSCDPELNAQRQTSLFNESVASSFPSFFSKAKGKSIRPYKSPRSVEANFRDNFFDSENTNNLESSKDGEPRIEDTRWSNYQSLVNPSNAKFDRDTELSEDGNSTIDGSHDDERDLINLKKLSKIKKENRGLSKWKWMLDEEDDKSTIVPHIALVPPGSSRRRSNSSRSINRVREMSSADQKSSDKGPKTDGAISQFGFDDKEPFPYHRPITNRYPTSYQNLRSANLAAELTKLEEDYKNIRLSSLMRAEERNKDAKAKMQKDTVVENDTERNANVNYPKNFIGRSHNAMTKNTGRESTLSIDIKLALRPMEKSTINLPISGAVSTSTCSRKPLPTTSSSFPETGTPAILRQKIVSDRVYPSKRPLNVSGADFHPTEFATSLSQKFESDVADLLANAVMSENNEDSSDNDRTSNDDLATLETTRNATSHENSITDSIHPFAVTGKNLHDAKGPGTSFDKPSNQVESPSDSTSSFSSGNLIVDDAIPLSGSLKNQLANWFSHDEPNNFELESSWKKLNEHAGQDSEVRQGGEVGEYEATKVPTTGGDLSNEGIRFEDRATTTVHHRRPVEVHLSSERQYDTIFNKENEEITELTRQQDDEASRDLLDYSIPEEMNCMSSKKVRSRNPPRSQRSVDEDESPLVQNNDRQRNIDRQIENEFAEISDALRDAADGSKVLREKPKSEATFEQDNSLVQKFAMMFNKVPKPTRDNRLATREPTTVEENREARTGITKQTEDLVEPVSEIMLTTEHRIIVDRFKIIEDVQKIPIDREKSLQETASRDSSITNIPPKLRERKQESSATAAPSSTTMMENEPIAERASEIFQTTGQRIIVHRFDIVNDFKDFADEEPLRKEISTQKSLAKVSPTIRDRDSESHFKFGKFDEAATINRDTSFRSALSPVLMIENLKKELRKEAERYSSISTARSAPRRSNFEEFRENAEPLEPVREVNTALTPAEKVEDSITDEETLPPDEETKYTTDPVSKTAYFRTTGNGTLIIESSTISESIFPGLAIQSYDAKFTNNNRRAPLRRAKKILILLEETSASSTARSARAKYKRPNKKILHRRRDRRNNRHNRRSFKEKRNIVDTAAIVSIAKGRSENEDDEHPWYDTSTVSKATNAINLGNNLTTRAAVRTTLPDILLQNRKKRFNMETAFHSRNFRENYRRAVDFSKESMRTSTARKFYLSVTRIPESDYRPKAAGLRIEEIPKKIPEQSVSNSEEAKISSMNGPEKLGEVDEMPIFRSTKNLNTEQPETGDKVTETSGRSKRNLHALIAGKLFDDKLSLDAGTGRTDVGRRNKRNYPIDSYESEPEPEVFYDYDDVEALSEAASGNGRSNRIVDSLVPEDLPPVNREKYQRDADNSDETMIESSLPVPMNSNKRLIVKRRSSTSRDRRPDGRSNEEIVPESADLFRKDFSTEPSASLSVKGRTRENFTVNQFGIEPSDGWKEKMELLKLKKHADVLKEYLNWRQDVGSPESQGIPGYTTRISLTNAKDRQTSDFFASDNFRPSDETTLPSTVSTHAATTDQFTSTVEQSTDINDSTIGNDEHSVTNVTTSSDTFETTVIQQASNTSENCSDDSTTVTMKEQTSTDCLDNKSEENDDGEASTGRILPPCGHQTNFLTTCRMEQESVTLSTPDTSSNFVQDNRKHLSDIDEDLIIISVMEQNRLKNKHKFRATKRAGASSRLHRLHGNVVDPSISRHHRHHHKSKNNKIPSVRISDNIRHNRRAGRQLMSFVESDESDNQEEDPTYEDIGANSSNDEDAFNGEEIDSEIWNQKWNRMIDKIIHENSTNSWKSTNASALLLKETTNNGLSAMQHLRFNNADKYIRQIAKNIVHNTNIHETKHEEDEFADKSEARRHKESSRRHRPARRHEFLQRKLQSHPIARRKVVGDSASGEEFENYENKRSALRVRSKPDDLSEAKRDVSAERSYPGPRKADANAVKETSDQDKGRDFAISLSGKIHVEGGTNGQPMSISFDTSPEIQNGNETTNTSSIGVAKFDNATKSDGETAPSTNFLSSLFNIATVPKDLAHHSPEENKNVSANSPIRQSMRGVDEERLRSSRENRRQEYRKLSRKHSKIRKSRAADEEDSERFYKDRRDRSHDLGDLQYSAKIDEGSNSDDYSESSNDDYYSDVGAYGDAPVASAQRASPSSGNSCPKIDIVPGLDDRRPNGPEVKVIKIIPLNAPKSSRMTASQMPKMNDDHHGETVKPGKIEPAALPWRENGDENKGNPVLDTMDEIDFPESPHSCSSKSEASDEHSKKADDVNESSIDRRISTSTPVNLKVIGLISMKQPWSQLNAKSNLNSEPNYEIVPLVHVKIQQQSDDRGVSSQPTEQRRPDIDTTNSLPDSHRDQLPCSKINNEGSNKQSEDSTDQPEVATLNMDNDEELREPIQIGSCPGSNRKDTEILADYSSDNKPDRTRPTEVLSPCGGHRETTTPKTRIHDDATDRSKSRKKIRLKNMLAIMEFMKKIKEIMNGGEPEISDDNNRDIAIKIERVVVLPKNRSSGIRNEIEEPEESTDRVVMIGEGVRHKPPTNGIYFEKNFRLSNNKGSNDSNDSSNSVSNFDEVESANKTAETNGKTVEKNRDKSFLFYGENDEIGGLNHSAVNDSYRGNADTHPNEANSEDVNGHKNQLIERLKNAQKVDDANSNEDDLSAEASGENSSKPYVDPSGSEPNDEVALQNAARKINDRFRSHERSEHFPGEANDVSTKVRKAADYDFSSIPKTKRHQSSIRRMRYDSLNGRDAEGKMYRRRSLPTGREVSRLTNGKFERYAAAKGIPKGKRARKKKKKKRRHKKKKKKKKKKKGKSHREAAVKGRAWWPFGRQLMSVSEERGLILDSNFDRNKVELVETKRYGNRRVSLPFDARRRRRVHRAEYPHDRNKKKRRKHKKRKKKKKKKKTKKSKGEDKKKAGLRSKRQIKPGGTQVRGGQDCMDRRHPSDVNPAKYLESAHCLRFSDMWYSIYELESPIMEHTVYLQLFEKHSLEDGRTHWDDLTQGTMVRMGTFTRHQRDSKPTIAFTYTGAKIESPKRALNLDPAKQRLLVPSPVPTKKSSRYSDAKSGLGEYLVVQSSAISKDGNDCDKAGVGFAAFAKQEDRCGRAKGTCLKNQPLAYWRHDTQARESGRPGCYFLSNFATVPTNPIKYNVSGSGSREYLGLEYHSAHVSAIDIEVRTDYNAIIRVGSSGRVTEVYVDSTALEHTVVTVVISNMGLASSPYQPRITDCPAGLPVSWSKAKGIMQVIPPQHDQRVTLDLYGQLLINGFHCSVEVVNHRGELVAMRRIRVQKMDRCFCVWHCLCACIGSVSGMGCQPMSPEHYHAAGFQGPVPVVTTETSILMNAVKDVFMLSALLVLLLLLLGILKWFVGMFVPAVGRWGLDSLLDGSRIEKYLEPELKCRCVVTDDNGAPVHPDTGQRTVRICSRKLEFVLNLIFFLTYPIAMCCSYFKRSLNESRQRNCCPDESKMCLINEKESCPKMICVSTYGDSRNTKLEAEDTRYVMNELKKSQESLGNPKRTKKKDSNASRSDKKLSKKASRKNKSASDVRARRFVDDLLNRRMVFRNLTEPIGGLSIPAGVAYSLRGYFLNAEDGGYRFITPCPFQQHWLIVNNEKRASKPPEIHPSNHFMRSYGTARDVYESNELSLTPRGVCVNVQYLEDG